MPHRSMKVWIENHKIKILSWPAQSELNPTKKNAVMWSRERWMLTSHQTKLIWLDLYIRSGINSPKMKDWRRACQDALKLWWNVRLFHKIVISALNSDCGIMLFKLNIILVYRHWWCLVCKLVYFTEASFITMVHNVYLYIDPRTNTVRQCVYNFYSNKQAHKYA